MVYSTACRRSINAIQITNTEFAQVQSNSDTIIFLYNSSEGQLALSVAVETLDGRLVAGFARSLQARDFCKRRFDFTSHNSALRSEEHTV